MIVNYLKVGSESEYNGLVCSTGDRRKFLELLIFKIKTCKMLDFFSSGIFAHSYSILQSNLYLVLPVTLILSSPIESFYPHE